MYVTKKAIVSDEKAGDNSPQNTAAKPTLHTLKHGHGQQNLSLFTYRIS